MKLLALILLFAFEFQAQEISCGLHNREHPCKCYLVRMKKIQELREKCQIIGDRVERASCFYAIPECHDVAVIDKDNKWKDGKEMPIQCQRWCTTAVCKCCVS